MSSKTNSYSVFILSEYQVGLINIQVEVNLTSVNAAQNVPSSCLFVLQEDGLLSLAPYGTKPRMCVLVSDACLTRGASDMQCDTPYSQLPTVCVCLR